MAVDWKTEADTRTEEESYTQRGMHSALRHRPINENSNIRPLYLRTNRQPHTQEGPYEETNRRRQGHYDRHTDPRRQTHPATGTHRRVGRLPDTQEGPYGDEGYQGDSYEDDGYEEDRRRRDPRPINSHGQKRRPKAVAPTPIQRTDRAPARRRTVVVLMLGAIVALLLIMLTNALVSWGQGVMDNIHYGYPRTSQLDAVVGHNDSPTNETHFVFLNLHGHVQIIEIPGGDASHARIFVGPTLIGAGQDLIPVTGEIRNEDGRRDLIVHIQDQQIVYINDGSTFHQQ